MNGSLSQTTILALCLLVLLVIAVNAGLWFIYRRGGPLKTIESFRKVSQNARYPFKKEDDDLDELAQRVAALKKPPQPPQEG